jgi:hypothetical protein
MKEAMVSPKFTVPGDRSRWIVRALWASVGLVAVQGTVLTVALFRRQAAEAGRYNGGGGALAVVAPRAAPAPEAPKSADLAEAASANALAADESSPSEKTAKPAASSPGARKSVGSRTRRSRHAATSSGRLYAKTGVTGTSSNSGNRWARTTSKGSSSSKPDAIDNLLRNLR